MKNIAVVYGELKTPLQKKALEQISSVVLEHTMEQPVCIKWSEFSKKEDFRYIYIGTKESNPYIAENSKKALNDKEEYCINVTEDSIMIEGYDDAGVLYGCVDFYNKYIVKFENLNDSRGYFRNVLYEEKLPVFEIGEKPSVKNRGLWTWGHVIYNYRGYIDNMLKLKLNTLVIWNDFVPVNAEEIIEYAHDCNIKVIWGYSWLWDTQDVFVDMEKLYDSIDPILEKYEKEYKHLNVDGIYFQSFTERLEEKIGDTLIAEAVTGFVNEAAKRFFEKFGEMELQFGLHATSVHEKLEYIKNVDPRVRLYWEDCGSFPFDYIPKNIDDFDKTKDFVIKTAHLRENEKYGAVTKGLICLDWTVFKHPKGNLYAGKSTDETIRNLSFSRNKIWRYIQAYWLSNADKAYEMCKLMCEETNGDLYVTALVEDGMFEENIMYPVALYAEMLWNANGDIKEIVSQTALRSYVKFA